MKILLGILSTCSHLSFSACIEALPVANTPYALTTPFKGKFAQLTTQDLQQILLKHEEHLETIGISQNNAECWYAIANEYRHLCSNNEATSFAEIIYSKLIVALMVSDNLKSLRHCCLSKYYKAQGLTQEALNHALTAAMVGRESKEFGQTLLYIGNSFNCDFHDQSRAKDYYLSTIKWCETHGTKKWHVKALNRCPLEDLSQALPYAPSAKGLVQ